MDVSVAVLPRFPPPLSLLLLCAGGGGGGLVLDRDALEPCVTGMGMTFLETLEPVSVESTGKGRENRYLILAGKNAAGGS